VDLFQADGQHLPFGSLLLGDPPSQIHLREGDEALRT
jgi:hypothetical protein